MKKQFAVQKKCIGSTVEVIRGVLIGVVLLSLLTGCASNQDTLESVPDSTITTELSTNQDTDQVETTDPSADLTETKQNPDETADQYQSTVIAPDGSVVTVEDEQGEKENSTEDGQPASGDSDISGIISDTTVEDQLQLDTVSFVLETVTATAKTERIPVTIATKNNPGVASIGLVVSWDNALELKKIEYNQDICGQHMMPQTLNSPVKLTWISPFENATGDWVFVTLYYSVPADCEPGMYPILIQYDPEDIYDITETNLDVQVISGGIIVNQ